VLLFWRWGAGTGQNNSTLSAFSRRNGKFLWSEATGWYDEMPQYAPNHLGLIGAVDHNDREIVIARIRNRKSGDLLWLGLDALSGKTLWQRPEPAGSTGDTAVAGTIVVAALQPIRSYRAGSRIPVTFVDALTGNAIPADTSIGREAVCHAAAGTGAWLLPIREAHPNPGEPGTASLADPDHTNLQAVVDLRQAICTAVVLPDIGRCGEEWIGAPGDRLMLTVSGDDGEPGHSRYPNWIWDQNVAGSSTWQYPVHHETYLTGSEAEKQAYRTVQCATFCRDAGVVVVRADRWLSYRQSILSGFSPKTGGVLWQHTTPDQLEFGDDTEPSGMGVFAVDYGRLPAPGSRAALLYIDGRTGRICWLGRISVYYKLSQPAGMFEGSLYERDGLLIGKRAEGVFDAYDAGSLLASVSARHIPTAP
jgi:hypothetical protein